MKRVLSLLVVLAMVLVMVPAVFAVSGAGTSEDPYVLDVGVTESLTVPASDAIYVLVSGPVTVTVAGDQMSAPYWYVQVGKNQVTPQANGACEAEIPEGISDYAMGIFNTSEDTAIELQVTINAPAVSDGSGSGTEEDPFILEDADLGDRTVTTSGVTYYKWVASGDGTFALTIDENNIPNGYVYNIEVYNPDTDVVTETGEHADDWNPAISDSQSVKAGNEVTFYVGFNYYAYEDLSEGTVGYNVTFTPDGGEPAPTEPAPTEPAPTEPAPTEPAPTEPAPTEPAPTEPAPTEPAPTEPTPTEPTLEESVISDVKLQLGENTLTLDPNAKTTIFEFVPAEPGVYKFVTEEGFLLGYWGAGTFYTYDATGEDKTNVLESEVSEVGPSIMVGVTGQGTCTVTATREGDAGTDPTDEIDWTDYVNKVEPTDFADFEDNAEQIELDVINNEYTAVLGDDGYYHLDAKDGPILLVNLDSSIVSLKSAIETRTLRAVVYDEDGNIVAKIDFSSALREYVNCANASLWYPLTDDLIYILQTAGEDPNHGWYDPENVSYLFGDAEAGADAWMFACGYVKTAAPTTNPDEPPKTGDDFNIALMGVLLLTSGVGIAALSVSKKKFF